MSVGDGVFAEPRRGLVAEDCFFYHAMDVPGLGAVGDRGWDLRGRVAEYLGGITVANRRVLEIGPASGFLTFEMEAKGAEVVAIELGPTTPWAIVPQAELDTERLGREQIAIMEKVRNSFWFAHEALDSHAQVHYGTADELPRDLAPFDIALMASVLLHTRDPLRIVENCARLTADALVIVERHFPELDGAPVARLEPTRGNGIWDTWWSFSPEMIVNFCAVLGFTDANTTFHEQRHFWPDGDLALPFFTVVARRSQPRLRSD